jgi:hypothetical protein
LSSHKNFQIFYGRFITLFTTAIHWVVLWPRWIKSIPSCRLVVKALGYKPEGRGFETRWGESLNLPNPSGRTRPWGLLSL